MPRTRAAAALLLCAAGAHAAAPPGLVDWARPATGARAASSHGPLCWGPPVGTFADGLAVYCTSVGAAFDGQEATFWAEPGGVDGPLPHPSPASPAWLRVDFAAPVRLRGARLLVGTSLNYTLEVSAASVDGPWRVLATHTCDQDLGCSLGYPHTYLGGYDPTPEASPKRREIIHAFDSGAPVAHARWRNTWASLGGYACGDVCLWTDLVFALELWGDPQGGEQAACPAEALGEAVEAVQLSEPKLGGVAGAASAALRAGLASS